MEEKKERKKERTRKERKMKEEKRNNKLNHTPTIRDREKRVVFVANVFY